MLLNFFKDPQLLVNIFSKSYSFLLGMLGALIIVLIMQCFTQSPKVVATVDVTQITQNFIKEMRSKSLSQEALKSETKLFGKQLEKTIKQFAKKNNLVLMPAEAVIAGGQDYTSYIAGMVKGSMSDEENVS
jgi:hypothetical protein